MVRTAVGGGEPGIKNNSFFVLLSFNQLPRIASFVGTTNERRVLTDRTGSRRFLILEPEASSMWRASTTTCSMLRCWMR